MRSATCGWKDTAAKFGRTAQPLFEHLLFHSIGTIEMDGPSETRAKPAGPWIGSIMLCVAHLIVFGMLYLVLVQIHWAYQDFFKLVGAKPTPRFETISMISDHIAAYTPIVFLVIAADIFIVFRLSRKASRWTSAYSHSVLLCMGFMAFLWTAWAVDTMAWNAPGIANGAEVVAADLDITDGAGVLVSART